MTTAAWTSTSVQALLAIEGDRIPWRLWEPAAGDGTGMVLPLRAAGFHVVASDVAEYGCPDCTIADYLTAELPAGVEGIITNPPFVPAPRFIEGRDRSRLLGMAAENELP